MDNPSQKALEKIVVTSRGSVLLEFAICMSLIFLLAFSVISLSLALRERATLAEASRVAARAASMLAPGTSSDIVNETALFAAARYLDHSGFPSGHYSYKILPSHISLANTGIVELIHFEISQHGLGISSMLGRLAGDETLVAEFPLSKGNSATNFDSEVSFHVN